MFPSVEAFVSFSRTSYLRNEEVFKAIQKLLFNCVIYCFWVSWSSRVFFVRVDRKKLVIYRIQIEFLAFFESNFSQLQKYKKQRGNFSLWRSTETFSKKTYLDLWCGLLNASSRTYFSETCLAVQKEINEETPMRIEKHAWMSGRGLQLKTYLRGVHFFLCLFLLL